MASSPFTRTTRATGLSTRSSTRNNVAIPPGNHHNTQQSNIGRKKRARDSADHNDQIVKKQRIAIEITSHPTALPKTRSVVVNSNAKPTVITQCSESPKHVGTTTSTQTEAPPTLPTPSPPRKPVNHHEKVVNGIKHELDRLQPAAADLNKDEKRKLRSQEGVRFKSELSAYFPEYDEVIGNEEKEEHFLNLDTPIIIVDSAKPSPPAKPTSSRKANTLINAYPLKDFQESLFTDLHNAQRIDYSFLDNKHKEEGGEDLLSDAYLESIHKKPERQERAIRNTDRGRAQHEKDQVIRLLEGLQGHDWLKLMGVSGITDSRKKEYEPARAHFIRGCEAIIEKFRIWREEEKRQKLEKEAAMAEAEEAEEEEGEEEEAEEEGEEEQAQEAEVEEEDEGNVSDGDPPDYSDVDASAARQLHDEAIARSRPASKHPGKRAKDELIPQPVLELQKEFKSFFSKPHLRDAALGRIGTRRSNRKPEAWGQPVPEVPEADFDLPEEYRDEETLKAHARRKRRDRRVSKS